MLTGGSAAPTAHRLYSGLFCRGRLQMHPFRIRSIEDRHRTGSFVFIFW
ncbi:hypothetical protein FM125_06620 [Micrococcus lylae]|uniref:Uncharacterized protein n=1 Tax=Micrococcus lylae TaxID=1273 RepID=A0A1R4J5U7_9MICC|nr:hypothetical protein FM125_06620 [Micrococcus lylae]